MTEQSSNTPARATICAVATGPVAAGVAIVRLSGPQAWAAAATLCPSFAAAQPRFAHYGRLQDAAGQPLDHALVLGFKAPHSFTGEDVVEVQCHGGRAGLDMVMEALLSLPHVRAAGPGEFTRRAVENGKMDLTAAEGLADLIAAESAAQHKQAQRQLQGALAVQFESWRSRILGLLAQVEAAIDFPDEELDVLSEAGLQQGLQEVMDDLGAALAERAGERVRSGVKLAIVGRPNAGKSTLTNLLTGQETAIVSPTAGTTRDVVQASVQLFGLPVMLADTAGLRESEDAIEQEGIRRARQQVETADVRLVVVDGADAHNTPAGWELPADVAALVSRSTTLVVLSKADQLAETPQKTAPRLAGLDAPCVLMNLTDAAAASAVLAALKPVVEGVYAPAMAAATLTRERHRVAVQHALAALRRGQSLLAQPPTGVSLADLLAQDLRAAALAIGTVTGRTGSEDVLDVVFSTFCIGK